MATMSLGLCCLNTVLRNPPKKDGKRQEPVFTSRTCRLSTMREKGIDYLIELGKANLEDLVTILSGIKRTVFTFSD